MTVLIKHSKVSTIPDTDDTSLVRPSDWNADHVVVGAAESGANSDITSLSGITGGISSPDYIQFDTAYATPLAQGQLGWDGNDTLAVGMAGGNVIQHIGEDQFIYIKADAAITKGQVIMFTGAVGASGVLTGAPATGVTNPQYIMGIAAENLAHNSFGLVQTFGELTGINTNLFNEGDVLYYDSAVTGGLTNIFPTSGPIVLVAAVAKKSAGNGTLVVRVSVTQRITAGTGATITQSNTGTTVAVTNPYNPAAVAITGGTINGTSIGATTPSTGTFTALDIATTGTDAEIAPNTGITGWNYSGKFKSVATEETSPTGLFFSPDGLNMYVNGTSGDDVNQYTLSTAWDVSTASYVRVFSTAAQDSAPNDIFFKPDGLTMFIMGGTNDTVFQYTLSSAWDISTASYASKSFSVTTQEATPAGLWFKTDGTVMYVIGTTNDTVYQYNLGTAWDVSTASYASISFSVGSQESSPAQVNLSADGTKMWITGSSGDDINEYTLGTAWDVSTATFVNNFYVGFQDTSPQGLFIDSTTANRVYIVGQINDTVYQYDTETNSISAVTDVFNTTSNARVQGNLSVQSNAYVDNTLTVLGSVTLGNTTTGNLSSSGTTNLATATGTQSPAFGSGATQSGSTKTVNIGTNGVSGSTTNINIGSAVSGATSRTTLNGIVIDSISAAITAAGATQGTATALVSNINNVTVVATNADGVILPTAVAGMRILVRNSDSADTLKIYPATGGTINALAANAAFTLAAGTTTELFASTTTQWYTF